MLRSYSAFVLFLLCLFSLITSSAAAPYCRLKPNNAVASSTTTASATSPSGSNSLNDDDIIASAWIPGWQMDSQSDIDAISWDKYNRLSWTFGVTTSDVNTISLTDSGESMIPYFVQSAHNNGVNASLSIGGWSGSLYFSTAVATAANRTAFVNAVLGLVSQYDLDGIDFDWEYPNKQGIGCNAISTDDSANFLSFLQELRQQAGSNLILTAAVGLTPFNDATGTPMTNVSAFAQVLDYIEIMNYDVWGTWDTQVGPNAPLNDSCSTVLSGKGSAVSAVDAWTSASFPSTQIVLGMAAYGHSFAVSTSSAVDGSTLDAFPTFEPGQQPLGDSADSDTITTDECGNTSGATGIFHLWGLVEGGFLTTSGEAANGIVYRYDNCSQTPYVYNTSTQVMVSYDDATSFAAKGEYVNQANLRGFAMWDVTGDYDDILIDAISNAIGIEAC